jgi:hypothetical protein
MSPEDHVLFDRWVIVPLAALRAIPRGDGAFAALTISFGLYERFIASKIHKRGESADDGAREKEASKDFDEKVSAADFRKFWEMYRVGMQHYFHPKHFIKAVDKTRWGWDISEGEGYKAYPVIVEKEADHFVITINPWAFAEHVVKRWYEFPELMDELSATTLGIIRAPDIPEIPLQVLNPASPYKPMFTYSENPTFPGHSSTGKWS